MKPFVFRKAIKEDLEDIIILLCDDEIGRKREKYSESISINYLNAFKSIDNDPNQFLMVVEINDAVIGTCHLTPFLDVCQTAFL